MSRNKDIKKLHSLSGKSYKECRETMKLTNWEFGTAVLILCPDILDVFKNAVDKVADAVGAWCQILSDACCTLAEEAERILREQLGEANVNNLSSGHTDQPEDEEEQSADRISERQTEADTV